MANTYHINPESGRVNICRALRSCPFGGSENHFDSKEEARAAYEQRNEAVTHITLEKDGDPLEKIPAMSQGGYPAGMVAKLSFEDKMRLLLRDRISGPQDAELPEPVFVKDNTTVPGDIFYSEGSKKLVQIRGANYYTPAMNLMTQRDVSSLQGYKRVANMFLGPEGKLLVGDEVDEARKASQEADAQERIEIAERTRLWKEKSEANNAELLRSIKFNPEPGYIMAVYLEPRDFSSGGMFGSSLLNHYDLDNYNENIIAIRDSNESDDRKAQLVFEERQKLANQLRDNLTRGQKVSAEEFVEDVFDRIRGKFLFGEAKETFISEREQYADSLASENEYKRERGMKFIRELIAAPYFVTVKPAPGLITR